jgi:hypothetical protein
MVFVAAHTETCISELNPPNAYVGQRRRNNMRKTMLCLVAFATALTLTGCGRTDPVEIPFSPDFIGLVEGGNLSQVRIIQKPSGHTYVVGEAILTDKSEAPKAFCVQVAEVGSVMELLRKNQVEVDVPPPQNQAVWQCVSGALPLLLVLLWVGVIIFVLWLAVRFVRAVERIAKNTEK